MPEPSTRDDYAQLTRQNEDAVLAAEERGSARVDALPMKITFEFTGDCNLHCFFCDCEFGRNEFRKQGVHKFAMDEATFRTMAERAFPKATVVNPTVIGEPFTFPYFDLMLEYAERFDVKLEIVTNGMLLVSPRVERLLPLLDRLVMSFDGGTKETFELCRTGSRFDKVIANLRRFRDLRREMGLTRQAKFSFGVTLMRENVEELPRIVEWAHELDVDEVCVSHLLVFTADLRGSSLFEHKGLANEWIARAHETAQRLGVKLEAPRPFEDEAAVAPPAPAAQPATAEGADEGTPLMAARMEHLSGGASTDVTPRDLLYLRHESKRPSWAGEKRLWCKFAWREVFINISGDVAPCCHQSRPIVGNVFRDEWDDIWNGAEYQALRSGLYERRPQPYCASCSLLAEQGWVDYDEGGYIFEDRYPEQTRANLRPDRGRDS